MKGTFLLAKRVGMSSGRSKRFLIGAGLVKLDLCSRARYANTSFIKFIANSTLESKYIYRKKKCPYKWEYISS